MLAAVIGMVWLGWVVLRAFWAIVVSEQRMNLKRIGWMEVAYTIVFVVFVSLGLKSL